VVASLQAEARRTATNPRPQRMTHVLVYIAVAGEGSLERRRSVAGAGTQSGELQVPMDLPGSLGRFRVSISSPKPPRRWSNNQRAEPGIETASVAGQSDFFQMLH